MTITINIRPPHDEIDQCIIILPPFKLCQGKPHTILQLKISWWYHVPNYSSFILYLLDPRSGPAYDLQVLRKMMWANKIPQVLAFMCMDAQEVSMGNNNNNKIISIRQTLCQKWLLTTDVYLNLDEKTVPCRLHSPGADAVQTASKHDGFIKVSEED